MTIESDNEDECKVRDAYRSISTETAPESLNSAVLREAGAIQASSVWVRFYSWGRPFAFAATLVLGVALVYDMQSVLREPTDLYLTAPASLDRQEVKSEAATPAVTVDSAARSRPATKPAGRSDAAADSVQSTTTENGNSDVIVDAPPATARKFSASPIDDIAVDMQQRREPSLESSQNGAAEKREIQQAPAAAFEESSRKAVPVRSLNSLASPARETGSNCRESAQSPPDWWQCIKALRSAGETEAAEAELRKLTAAYPDFGPPE